MSRTNKEHQEANDWAMQLMMPEVRFRELVEGGMKNIGDLAEYFGVSALAVRHRARMLEMKGHGLTRGYRNIENT